MLPYNQQQFKEIPLSQKKRGARRSSLYGKGINDAPYMTSYSEGGVLYICPFFLRWKEMFTRCYSKRWLKTHPTYQGCEVSPEWHSFMAFRAWMETQQWVGKQLDKDLLSLDKKIYSPQTCLFVSRQVNSLFNKREFAQGSLPLGIYPRKGKFEVGCSMGEGKRVWIGVYATVGEAIDAYISAKRKAVSIVLQKEKDPRTVKAVMTYMDFLADRLTTLKAGY